ncbi:Piwi domain-containing protein [Caenorhabditis elegans]|nr:Piwi domain-containing protein [Caenorhabditis elegans]CTQ86863.1 Piwi domain-containing protein [Caenorhabditis elegans]|eukprot:NP_001300164.1 Piwi-like protein ergo-1 [Caenorhabditis elegans]
MKYDAALRACNVSDENLRVMTQILTKMTLQLSTETGDYVGEDGEVIVRPAPTIRNPGRNFKFVGLGAPADRYYFTSDGVELTVADYYLQKYNIRLRYPNLPCVLKKAPEQCGNKHSAMPLELVSYIVVPTRYGGFTMPDMRADMINKTTYTAQQRGKLLQHIIAQKSLSGIEPPVSNNDDYMKKHKLVMKREPIRVKATILPPPTLVYGDSVFHDEHHIGEWEAVTHDPPRQVLDGAVFRRKLYKSSEQPLMKRLMGSILLIQSPRQCRDFDYNQQGYHAIMRAIEDSGQPVLWADENKHSAVIQGELQFNQNQHGIEVIEQFLQNIKSTIGEYERDGEVIVPIVFAVFQARATVYSGNNNEYNDYNVLKYLADNKYGIHTQGILEKSLGVVGPSPKNCALTRLMVEKVLGKVGTTHRKLERGGAHKTWTIFTDPAKPTLVLGIDVSHPSTRDRETGNVLQKMSAATVVGNIDLDVTEFRASSRIQDTGVECLIDFSKEIDERIGEFIDHTGKRPAHIVVYRDGLSEGDFQKYLFEERVCIEERCLKIDTSFQPSITYIVVTKRHHTQFFLEDPSQGYESQGYNVLPGTLIEDAVTTNKYYDFFLSTQIGNEGCFRPTHYYVLHDTWTGKPDSFWPTVTHALTYNFCRSTTTVALPAPVLYAHLAAKRAKETLDGINTYKSVNNIYCDLESFGDLCEVNKDMNVNEKLEGMTFV